MIRVDAYPEIVGIGKMGLRVALLGVDKRSELGRVANEEDRGVVEDPIEVAFLCLDLGCHALQQP